VPRFDLCSDDFVDHSNEFKHCEWGPGADVEDVVSNVFVGFHSECDALHDIYDVREVSRLCSVAIYNWLFIAHHAPDELADEVCVDPLMFFVRAVDRHEPKSDYFKRRMRVVIAHTDVLHCNLRDGVVICRDWRLIFCEGWRGVSVQ